MNIISSLLELYVRLFHRRMSVAGLSDVEYDNLETYYNKLFGYNSFILHEILSSIIHIDIAIYPPTDKKNYYALATMGMSAKQMNSPLKRSEFEYAELVMYLPPDWKIDRPHAKTNYDNDANNWWPFKLLKITAKLPFDTNSWLGYGHSVSDDEKYSPYANTKFCAAVLLDPSHEGIKFDKIKSGTKEFFVFGVIPVYKEELDYKAKHGVKELDKLFKQNNISRVIDINRINVAKNHDK